ncbi:MAG: hypothetical protein KKG60_02845 [Nanoarchaeota archaeon]|nr:hypothetical protein [Nanoarchaeota archaeon]
MTRKKFPPVDKLFRALKENTPKAYHSCNYHTLSLELYLWQNSENNIHAGIGLGITKHPEQRKSMRYMGRFNHLNEKGVPDSIVVTMDIVDEIKGHMVNTKEKKREIYNYLESHLVIPALKDLEEKIENSG